MASKSITSLLVHTSALLRQLFNTSDVDEFIEKNRPEMKEISLVDYIDNLAKSKNEPRERIIKRAGIERTYGHQLFRGIRMPSRDKVLQLAFGLELNVDKTQQLLRVADMSLLYPRIERDAIILYCISHHKNIIDTQNLLEKRGLTLLGCEDKRG